jgi:hypothetical protein
MQQGAASLILGFPFLSEASGAATAELLPYPRLVYPGLLGRAMNRMADECKPAIVLLIRPDHCNAKLSLGLAELLHDTSADAKRLFGQAVLVCVPITEAQAVFPLKDDSIAVLLDHKGRTLDELKHSPWPLEHGALQLTRFLHGPNRKHLALCSEAQRQALGSASLAHIETALRSLSSNAFREREMATRKLIETAPRASAILAEAYLRGPEEETRHRIDLVFDRCYSSLPDTAGQRMPFGVEWFDQPIDPCPGCGRVAFNPQMQRAVRALRWTQK